MAAPSSPTTVARAGDTDVKRAVASGVAWSVTLARGCWLMSPIATGLTGGCSEALAGLRQRQAGHDPGRVAVDLAVMLADGGEAIADLAVLRDQVSAYW